MLRKRHRREPLSPGPRIVGKGELNNVDDYWDTSDDDLDDPMPVAAAATAKPTAPYFPYGPLSDAEFKVLFSDNLHRTADGVEFCISSESDLRGGNSTHILTVLGPVRHELRRLVLHVRRADDPSVFNTLCDIGCLILFNQLDRFANLRVLDVSHCPVTDAGLRVLGLSVKHCPKLSHLILTDCQLGTSTPMCALGMRALADGLSVWGNVQRIDLSENELTLKAFATFVGNLSFRNLEKRTNWEDRTVDVLFEGNWVLLDALERAAGPSIEAATGTASSPEDANLALLQASRVVTGFHPCCAPVIKQLQTRNVAEACRVLRCAFAS